MEAVFGGVKYIFIVPKVFQILKKNPFYIENISVLNYY